MAVEIEDMLVIPTAWIKAEYCQVNYSAKITTTNTIIQESIRIFFSFVKTPFCTYIGQAIAGIYLFIMYNIISPINLSSILINTLSRFILI